MLGTLYSFFFAFIVVIMRHVKPKANETGVRMSIGTKGSSGYNCFKNASKRNKSTAYCIVAKNLNPGEQKNTRQCKAEFRR